jgi:hypothetical protein
MKILIIILVLVWIGCGLFAANKMYIFDRQNEYAHNLERINRIREKFALRLAFGVISIIVVIYFSKTYLNQKRG